MPSVLWHCWLGGRKGIRHVKKLWWDAGISEVQTCTRPSWCHCHSLSLASVKSRLVLPFWYRLTRGSPGQMAVKGCVRVLAYTVNAKCILSAILCWPSGFYSDDPSDIGCQKSQTTMSGNTVCSRIPALTPTYYGATQVIILGLVLGLWPKTLPNIS